MQDILTIIKDECYFTNCIYSWIIFPLFLILALFLLRSDKKPRKRWGKILMGFSVPGMLVALISFGIFLYRVIYIKNYMDPVSHVLDRSYYSEIGFGNESIHFWGLTAVLLPIEGTAALIAGIRCGRISGILSILLGILSIAGSLFFAYVYVLSMGN